MMENGAAYTLRNSKIARSLRNIVQELEAFVIDEGRPPVVRAFVLTTFGERQQFRR